MNTVCTLIENIDGKRKIEFSQEEVSPSFWVKTWKYVSLNQDKIDEIMNAEYKDVQDILKTL